MCQLGWDVLQTQLAESCALKHCNSSSKANLLHLHKVSKESNGAGKMIVLVYSICKTMIVWSSHHAVCKTIRVPWQKQTQDPFGSLISGSTCLHQMESRSANTTVCFALYLQNNLRSPDKSAVPA